MNKEITNQGDPVMLQNPEKLLLPIIRGAGKIMTGTRDIEGVTNEKGGDAANMVTAYDIAVQNYLIREITSLIPEAFFFAEEKENNAEYLKREYCFVIDPIDGTANFVHDYHKSAISVALFSHGEIVFAAVYDPYLDEMFSAVKECGAFLNGKSIRASEHDMAHAIVAFGTSSYYKDTLAKKSLLLGLEFHMKTSDIRRTGTAAIDLAYLAAGRNDIFFEYVLFPWDASAGCLLIKEAGGIITDFEGKPIDFSKLSSVFAATKTLYDTSFQIVDAMIRTYDIL